MTYRIAVLDDEVVELHKTEEILLRYAKEHPEHELEISCFAETDPFMEAVCSRQEDWERAFHILFMDICLPDGNGIEGARVLRQKGFEDVIIFKSTSAEYAIDAWAVGASNYLVKHVSREKFDRVMGKAIKEVRFTKWKQKNHRDRKAVLH